VKLLQGQVEEMQQLICSLEAQLQDMTANCDQLKKELESSGCCRAIRDLTEGLLAVLLFPVLIVLILPLVLS